MKADYVLGVRPWLCSGEPSGELVHGTGYHDRCGTWKNGVTWVRRYRDAKPHNGMSRHALRARDAFHALREMPARAWPWPAGEEEARAQAVTVLMHMLNWTSEVRVSR